MFLDHTAQLMGSYFSDQEGLNLGYGSESLESND